jgi:hypothetical protein
MGARFIGIEHTEAVPQNEAHTSFLREQGNGSDAFFISHALPGEPRKSKQQLLEEIALDGPGDGWAGDSPEREWADAMAPVNIREANWANQAGISTVPRKLALDL